LSGLFTLARPNPIEGAMIPKKAAAPRKTHAATPDEVMAILDLLEKAGEWKARAAVGLMFFTGLRPGEARGVRWRISKVSGYSSSNRFGIRIRPHPRRKRRQVRCL